VLGVKKLQEPVSLFPLPKEAPEIVFEEIILIDESTI
jgi:hypothetical protein